MGKRGGPRLAAHPAEELWGEALKRWYEQEQEVLPPPDGDLPSRHGRPFPPGWWILPAFVMSLAIWGVIGWMALG